MKKYANILPKAHKESHGYPAPEIKFVSDE